MTSPFDSIESALQAFESGSPVIVVDTDPGRACGAFVMAARHVTAEALQFYLEQGRGYLTIPVDQAICLKFGLRPLEGTRSDGWRYTISFNLACDEDDSGEGPASAADERGLPRPAGHGASRRTTGQSTTDRARAIRALIDPRTSPTQICTPGFVHPVLTTVDGVLSAPSFASAATDFCHLTGLEPAAVTTHILTSDGELARLEDLFRLASQHSLKIVSLEGLVAHRRHESCSPT